MTKETRTTVLFFAFHGVYNAAEKAGVESECRAGRRGCVDCKKAAAHRLNERLSPIREKRAEVDRNSGAVEGMIEDGNARALAAAEATIAGVRKLMKL